MRVAGIDIGTNTFLLLIAETQSFAAPKVLKDEARIVRLGQGVHQSRRFHLDALARANECLKEFRQIIDSIGGVDCVLAVATSAARDVENASDLIALTDRYKIPLKIISGNEEARLSFLGVQDFEKQSKASINTKSKIIIDIGGGSTELIFGKGERLNKAQSIDIGAVRLTEMFVTKQPILKDEQDQMRKYISEQIQKSLLTQELILADELIAVAGTPSALAVAELGIFDAQKVEGFQLSLAKLSHWLELFSETTIDEKKTKYHLGGRADIIYAGTSILNEIIKASKKTHVQVSTKGLRYGLVYDLMANSQP
jgi:exopolyphosphatase / guanosine-5'-triphosphate,3'-diphosphate pyrophosphatase